MKIVIDIDEDKYHWLKENNPKAKKDSIVGAIVWGKPLPKGHGDLIDRDVVRRKYQKMATDAYTVNIKAKMETVINACIDQLEYAQTIIESEE